MNDRSKPTAAWPELDFFETRKMDAAEGYHMIGQYREAADEIASIPPDRRSHPKILHVACRVYWALREIPEAMAYVDRYIEAMPLHPFGYCFKAMLLTHLGRHRDSYDLLKPLVSLFPNHATMHYDLASAAAECQLFAEARQRLYHAICIQRAYQQLALDNPVFASIRDEIEGMHPSN